MEGWLSGGMFEGSWEGGIFTITLGTQASGSTWLFNVVRMLHEAAQMPVFSAYADNGMSALDELPLDASHVIFKSHGMDQRFLKFARLSGARLLVSVREPKDSIVSQGERFDLSLQQAAIEISRAIATIRSLPPDIPVLRFAYEEGFTRTPETIALISQFLGIPVSDRTIAEIFDILLPHKVKLRIAERLAAYSSDEDPSYDPEAHWHAQHIGDGKVGKWRDRLDMVSQDIVDGCLNATMLREPRRGDELRWLPELFSYNNSVWEGSLVQLQSCGEVGYAVWGPYMCLPKGRWRATAMAFANGDFGPIVEADIFLPWEDRPVADCRMNVGPPGVTNIVLDFTHYDYFQPVEARLRMVEGSSGYFSFAGWKLLWMGPAD